MYRLAQPAKLTSLRPRQGQSAGCLIAIDRPTYKKREDGASLKQFGAILAVMPLVLDQAHSLLIAERSRDATTITEAISAVLATNPETNLLEIDQCTAMLARPSI